MLAFLAAMVLSDLLFQALGLTVTHSDHGGYSLELFRYRSGWQWVTSFYADAVLTGLAVVAFRWIRLQALAVGAASLTWVVLTKPAFYLALRLETMGGDVTLPWQLFFGPLPLLFSVLWPVTFLGGLAVAVKWMRALLPALLAGAVGGAALRRALLLGFRLLSRVATEPELVDPHRLGFDLIWSVILLGESAVFGLLLYAALRVAAPALRLGRTHEPSSSQG